MNGNDRALVLCHEIADVLRGVDPRPLVWAGSPEEKLVGLMTERAQASKRKGLIILQLDGGSLSRIESALSTELEVRMGNLQRLRAMLTERIVLAEDERRRGVVNGIANRLAEIRELCWGDETMAGSPLISYRASFLYDMLQVFWWERDGFRSLPTARILGNVPLIRIGR